MCLVSNLGEITNDNSTLDTFTNLPHPPRPRMETYPVNMRFSSKTKAPPSFPPSTISLYMNLGGPSGLEIIQGHSEGTMFEV